MKHTPLHQLPEHRPVRTAGRLGKCEHGWSIFNAHRRLRLELPDDGEMSLTDAALARVIGHRRDDTFVVDDLEVVFRPHRQEPPLTADRALSMGRALRERSRTLGEIRRFFDRRDFLEVSTRAMTPTPGTDPHIEPVPATFFERYPPDDPQKCFLHTSPELQMKRLVAAGSGPIFQMNRCWRNGEVTDYHSPEFTLLEWYRPWESVDAIVDDVEQLVCHILDDQSDRPVEPPIERMTMQQVVQEACGFDILEALDVDVLRAQIDRRDLLSDRHMEQASWDDLFFSLNVSHIDGYLSERGAVFVTDWPRPLAILARKSDDDPRVAERFELYVDGVELANGFGELTDAQEQRRRFQRDLDVRSRLDKRQLPLPEAFLRALQWGLPPSSGVALGVDRLLLLAVEGAEKLGDIAPFAPRRTLEGIRWP